MNNIKTTIGGILLAIGTAALGAPLPEKYRWIPGVVSSIGGAMLGLAAKDFDTHSTAQEVKKATIVEEVKKIEEEEKK